MSKYSKLNNSRNNWKQKASSRAKENQALRKELKRIKKERDNFKKEAKAKAKEHNNQNKVSGVHTKQEVVFIALQLFLVASIGFRAVSRVLKVLSPYLGLKKSPSPQTIINWVNRLSIARMQNVPQGHSLDSDIGLNGRIWILDLSIALGEGKILSVLSMLAGHHGQKTAPTLADMDCVGAKVATSWKGQDIADFLEKIINIVGTPCAFLMDGGMDLAKAVKILHEKGYNIPVIADISHMIANILKHAYADHSKFDVFTSACSQAAGKMKQTILACLAPPKLSTKGRFMNIHRLVCWAHLLLQHSTKGKAAKGSVLEKLRDCIGRLPECRAFIKKFYNDASLLLNCQKILKEKGLSYTTAQQCQSHIESISSSSVRYEIEDWLQSNMEVAKVLGLEEIGMPVSSDPIESLYGRAKFHGTGEIKDANRITLRLPALCGALCDADAQNVLEVSCAQEKELTGTLSSLAKQRHGVLPATGSLETLSDTKAALLELLPGSKKQKKIDEKCINSNRYKKRDGPVCSFENHDAHGSISA